MKKDCWDKNSNSMNPMQKGTRRQKLHQDQDNVGNDKNPPAYKSFDGEPLD